MSYTRYAASSSRLISEEVRRQLLRLYKFEFTEFAAVRKAALNIGRWELTATGFDDGLREFKVLLRRLYLVGQGDEWSVTVCKAVGVALANWQGGRLPLSQDNRARLRKMVRSARSVSDAESFDNFYGRTLLYLSNLYETRYLAVGVLRKWAKEDLSYFGDFRQTQEVEEAVQALLAGITELRKYGVKSCIMRDGLLQPPKRAWVINDGADTMRSLLPEGAELSRSDPPLAITMLAAYADIVDTKPVQIELAVGATPYRGLSTSFQSELTAVLFPDGRVTLDVGWAMVPLRDVFVEAGAAELYPLFHLLQLLRIYDLVVPIESGSRGAPQWPIYQPDQSPNSVDAGPTWRQLVVPRIRSIRDPEALRLRIEQEISDDQAFTDRHAGRVSESREIQGFLRRLPRGHRPSKEARELAMRERGWEIPEGYNYVRNHDWGTGPSRTAGHEAVRRSV